MPVGQALPSSRLAHSTNASRRRLLLTLLFLGAAGLWRTWELRGYTGTGLALLTGRKRAYGYRHIERFLSEVAQAGGAETLTDALAGWTTRLWKPAAEDCEPSVPVFFLDGHRKPVYSGCLLPRGVIGRTGKILGCRTLLLLHDDRGHPLLATTHRGDLHLTLGAPTLYTRYCLEQCDLSGALAELEAKERAMYELENGKDQCMTVLKLALANVGMWVRDQYFPATYAHATWHRLAPFFRLPGRVIQGRQAVWVELHPFNDRQLTRDLRVVCERVTTAQPRLPDGRRLCFTLAQTRSLSFDDQPCKVA